MVPAEYLQDVTSFALREQLLTQDCGAVETFVYSCLACHCLLLLDNHVPNPRHPGCCRVPESSGKGGECDP